MKLLALRGLLDDAPLDRLKGAQGYKNVAQDLESLVDMLQDNWSRIEGKVLTTRAELEHANRLATRLLRIVGEREHGPETELTAVCRFACARSWWCSACTRTCGVRSRICVPMRVTRT